MNNFKFNLLTALDMLAQLESNQWKSRAYRNAYKSISMVDESDLLTKPDFLYIPGVGKGISDKIIEYRETGVINKLVELMAKSSAELSESEYKVRKGYVSKRISYTEVQRLLDELGVCESDNLMVVGSYRRESNAIADIDLLAFTNEAYWNEVGRLSEIPGTVLLVSGDQKTSFRYNNPAMTQIDVNNGSVGNKWTQLLHHTGGKDSNIRLRAIAKKLGYTLNQYGLHGFDGSIESEKDIFKALNTPYVEPKYR